MLNCIKFIKQTNPLMQSKQLFLRWSLCQAEQPWSSYDV